MILIIDDMPIFREPISACLKLAGYETMCAGDGNEGLEMARKHAPDLILLDMAMPGMDGIQVLKKLRGEPSIADTPVLMLTAVTDRNRIVQAVQLGAREYLLKSRFSTKDLLARIEKHTKKTSAAEIKQRPQEARTNPTDKVKLDAGEREAVPPTSGSPNRSILDSEKCLLRIRQAARGKTLSGVVANVIAMAASPRADAAELAKLVSSDPVLTARVLGAANSAAYATKGGICTTVADAVRKIGFSGVRNITAAVGIFNSMPAAAGNGFSPIRYWQHSVAVAQLCESLASLKAGGPVSPGHAYICGLCHDLGEILVRCEFDVEYRQVLESERLTRRPREEIRQETLGLSHGRLALEALRAVGLPDNIRLPIEAYHAGKTSPDKSLPLPGMLRLMDRYANGLMLAANPESPIEPFDREFVQSVLGQLDFAFPDPELFCSQVRTLTLTLAGPSREEESQLLVPMYPKSTAKRVWLARDSFFAEHDPVHHALSQLAETKVYTRLPTASESSGYDYLVVTARNPTARGFTEDAIALSISAQNAPSPVLCLVSDAPNVLADTPLHPVQLPISLSSMASFLGS